MVKVLIFIYLPATCGQVFCYASAPDYFLISRGLITAHIQLSGGKINAMMHKEALRKVLEKLPDTEAVALAEAETAPGALKTLRKLSDSNQILAFLLTFTPVEAVGILKKLEPLTAGLLLTRIKQRMQESEQGASELVEIIRLCDLLAIGAWQDKI